VLLLAELRLQRVHALLEGFLVFLLLLLADRLARRLLGFLGGRLLRLQFRDDLVERISNPPGAADSLPSASYAVLFCGNVIATAYSDIPSSPSKPGQPGGWPEVVLACR